jgi:hypothetical protein
MFPSRNFVQEQPPSKITDARPRDRGQFSFALTVAAAAAVIVLAGLYLWPGRQSPSRGAPPGIHFSFGPAEQAYARKIHVENAALSRAENFLHQEVTTLSGELVNTGDQPLRAVEVTIEFSDELNQVVLREGRSAFAPRAPVFAPGERRSFEVSFEHIPSSWNMQQPVVHITGLQFTPTNK